jgi:L-ribulokinase
MMTPTKRGIPLALGLDFGTESVRALLVDLQGREHGSAVARYRHGQMTETLSSTGSALPPNFALQDPDDWIRSSVRAVRKASAQADCRRENVMSVGVDFTSCTMLPALRDGTPLCQVDRLRGEKYAWAKLWKHHGAKQETDRINQVARRRKEKWLDRYGGIIGLEWFFPKILETLNHAPKVYAATDVWLEAGDWYVWQLVGGSAESLPRSTCQAGYKAMWSRAEGYPSKAFFKALHPAMANVVQEKMPGRLLSPGEAAGGLTAAMARRFGLEPDTPVSAAVIDAHAGVPGAGVAEPGTLVMVLGTSSCHMLNAREQRPVPGVAGIVDGGILPGMFGYETGQAAVGDAFDWLRRTVGMRDFDQLTERASALPPGAEGVLCIDWLNGCRTPLMDGSLRGALTGLTLSCGPHHLYRGLLEASAYGLRWIVDLLQENGVPVRRLVATGGLPHRNPLLVQIYADVLGKPIVVHPSKQGPALGAAILGVLAAGAKASGFRSATAAIRAMAVPQPTRGQAAMLTVRPDRRARKAYDPLYRRYRDLAELLRKF